MALDVATISFVASQQELAGCGGLSVPVDPIWRFERSQDGDRLKYKWILNSAAFDKRDPVGAIVDAAYPSVFVTIDCVKASFGPESLPGFVDDVAKNLASRSNHSDVQRATVSLGSGKWEQISYVFLQRGTTLDSVSAHQVRNGQRISISIRSERGGASRARSAKLFQTGDVVTVPHERTGAPVAIRLTRPAYANRDSIWGVRTQRENIEFARSFLARVR